MDEGGSRGCYDDDDWNLVVSDDEKYNPTGDELGTWMPDPKDILNMFDILSRQPVIELKWKCPGRRLPQKETVTEPMEVVDDPQERLKPVEDVIAHVPVPNEFDFEDDVSVAQQPMRTPGIGRTPKNQKRVARMDKVLGDIMRQRQENQTGIESRFSKTPLYGSPKNRVIGSPRGRFSGSKPPTAPSKDRNAEFDKILSAAMVDPSAEQPKVSVSSVHVTGGVVSNVLSNVCASMSAVTASVQSDPHPHGHHELNRSVAGIAAAVETTKVPNVSTPTASPQLTSHSNNPTVGSNADSLKTRSIEPILYKRTDTTPPAAFPVGQQTSQPSYILNSSGQQSVQSNPSPHESNISSRVPPHINTSTHTKPMDNSPTTPLNLSHTPSTAASHPQSPLLAESHPSFKPSLPRPAHTHQQPAVVSTARSPKPAHSVTHSPQPVKRQPFTSSTEAGTYNLGLLSETFYTKPQLKPTVDSTATKQSHKAYSPGAHTKPQLTSSYRQANPSPQAMIPTSATLPVNLQKSPGVPLVNPVNLQKSPGVPLVNPMNQLPTNTSLHARKSPSSHDTARKKSPPFHPSELTPQFLPHSSFPTQPSSATYTSNVSSYQTQKPPSTPTYKSQSVTQPSLKLTVSKNLHQQQSARGSGLGKKDGKISHESGSPSYRISTAPNIAQGGPASSGLSHKVGVASPHKLSVPSQQAQKAASPGHKTTSPNMSRKVSSSPRGDGKCEVPSVETHRVIQTGPLSISIKATSIRDSSRDSAPSSQPL